MPPNRKRKSLVDKNEESSNSKKSMPSYVGVRQNEDYYSTMPVDCIIEVFKHLDREWIDELCLVNRKSHQASKAKCLEAIKLKDAELEIFKNSNEFCFILTVNRKIPRDSGKRNSSRAEVYIYAIDDDQSREQRRKAFKEDFMSFSLIREGKIKLNQPVPSRLFEVAKEIPFELKSLSIKSVKIDSVFIDFLNSFIDPSIIEKFTYRSCTIAQNLSKEDVDKAIEWTNAFPKRIREHVSAMKSFIHPITQGMAPKRKSVTSEKDTQSSKAKKGMRSSLTIHLEEDFYSNMPVDCIIEVCKHLDREWIDELSRVNRNSYQASKAKSLDAIKLKGAELEIYKNSTGFCFTLLVSKNLPRREGKRNIINSEVYIYHVADNGKREKRLKMWKSEIGLDNERSYNEKKPQLDQAIPAKLFKALKGIPEKYSLCKFTIRSFKIEAVFIEFLADFIDPSTITHFEYDKSCTIANNLAKEDFDKALEWLNALSDKSSARISVIKNAMNRALTTATTA